ncbi:MAG: DUF4157 domain-containing protein [Deltaproteobacteria bacterium]|nr:DUF4157 domain-containing protein [Deltaproteobacteria bacterium]
MWTTRSHSRATPPGTTPSSASARRPRSGSRGRSRFHGDVHRRTTRSASTSSTSATPAQPSRSASRRGRSSTPRASSASIAGSTRSSRSRAGSTRTTTSTTRHRSRRHSSSSRARRSLAPRPTSADGEATGGDLVARETRPGPARSSRAAGRRGRAPDRERRDGRRRGRRHRAGGVHAPPRNGCRSAAPARRPRRLEHGFGAELGAIRMHRDVGAARADHGAIALTAGAHVYWGAHAPAVESQAGERRVHAARIPGRASSIASVRASRNARASSTPPTRSTRGPTSATSSRRTRRATRGSSRRPRPAARRSEAERRLSGLEDPARRLRDVRDRGRGRCETDGPVVPDRLPEGDGALRRRGEAARASEPARPDEVVLARFCEAVRARGLGWIADVAKRGAFTKRFYSDALLNTYRALVFGPGRDASPIDDAELDAEWKRITDETTGKTNSRR